MPTSRIKEKISKLVGNQLPEFIQTDYTTFVKFIEYYYEFLEQDQGAYELIQNARSYADIDRTTAAFVKYFIANYSNNLPASIQGDKSLLIKNVKDLYESKGSELSFKLLFKVLYDSFVEIKYPYQNVLRASDGTWEQLVSIRVETVSGDRTKIDSHILLTTKNGIEYAAPVIKVLNLTSNLTEIFLSPISSIVLSNILVSEDEIYIKEDTNEVFRGKVKLTTNSYEVLTNKGKNFKVGQIFKVSSGGAVNTLFKISNVTPTGGINEIQFINYGYNFTSNVTLNFKADATVGSSFEGFTTTSGGFVESGVVFKNSDYFSEAYVDNIFYVMTEASTFSNTFTANNQTIATALDDEDFATIRFTLGVLGRYPGSWTTNRGFISDSEIRLQDDKLYQPFAYQLTTDKDLSLFYDVVKELIHPAGQSLFNNRLIESSIDLSSNVSVTTSSNVNFEAYDVAFLGDSTAFDISKNISGVDTVSITENNIYTFTKILSDTATVLDDVTIYLNKNVLDQVSIVDLETEKETILLTDSTALADSLISDLNFNINITESTVGTSESVVALITNYTSEDYFSEIYAGEFTTLL